MSDLRNKHKLSGDKKAGLCFMSSQKHGCTELLQEALIRSLKFDIDLKHFYRKQNLIVVLKC